MPHGAIASEAISLGRTLQPCCVTYAKWQRDPDDRFLDGVSVLVQG